MPWNYNYWAKTSSDAISVIAGGQVEAISLDHDLGDKTITGDGYEVASYIEKCAFLELIPRIQWICHSANPVGVQRMVAALKNADTFWSEHERKNGLCLVVKNSPAS
jgi:hypothetical protein